MVALILLDVDRLEPAAVQTLGAIMGIYGVQLIAVVTSGAMQLRINATLVEPFLATLARDVISVEVIEPFALVA
jgi:hypothetical protein